MTRISVSIPNEMKEYLENKKLSASKLLQSTIQDMIDRELFEATILEAYEEGLNKDE